MVCFAARRLSYCMSFIRDSSDTFQGFGSDDIIALECLRSFGVARSQNIASCVPGLKGKFSRPKLQRLGSQNQFEPVQMSCFIFNACFCHGWKQSPAGVCVSSTGQVAGAVGRAVGQRPYPYIGTKALATCSACTRSCGVRVGRGRGETALKLARDT